MRKGKGEKKGKGGRRGAGPTNKKSFLHPWVSSWRLCMIRSQLFRVCLHRSTVFTLDRKTASVGDVIHLENSHVVATVSPASGVLQEMSLKDSGDVVKTNLQFVRYGTRAGKERSGAYLFLPDGDAKVNLLLLLSTWGSPVHTANADGIHNCSSGNCKGFVFVWHCQPHTCSWLSG